MTPAQVQSAFNSMAKMVTLSLQRGAIQSIPEAQEAIGSLEVLQEFLRGAFTPPAEKTPKPDLKLVPPAPAP